uniref:WSN domain-containing protein n=1 Tax=Caenorhabditis tropicalis TaxID=1561998 RepID=A0A1I7UP88_9PELO
MDIPEKEPLPVFQKNPKSIFPDNKISDIISKLRIMTRISSGITLEIGLIGGTFPPEASVAELLRIGNVTLQDIIDLNDTAVLDILSLWKEDESKVALENWLVDLERIRNESMFMKTFLEFPGKKEYMEKLNDVENMNIKSSTRILSGWESDLSIVLNFLQHIHVNLNERRAKSILEEVDLLGYKLTTIAEIVEESLTILAPLKKAKEIEQYADFYKILVREYDIRKQLELYPMGYWIVELAESYSSIYSVRDAMNKSLSSVETLQKLIDSRDPSFQQSFEFIVGLPNRYLDLQRLEEDIQNPWMIDIVLNASIVFDGLKKAFSYYKNLSSEIEEVEKKYWKDMGYDSLGHATNANRLVSELPGSVDTATEALEKMRDCENMRKTPIGTLNQTKLDNIIELNGIMKNLNTLEYADEQFLNALAEVKAILPTDPNPPDKLEAARIYVEALKSSEHYAIVTQKVEQLLTDVKRILNATDSLPALVPAIQADILDLQEYHDNRPGSYPLYFKFFAYMREAGKETKLVNDVIREIRQFRIDLPKLKELIPRIAASKTALLSAIESAKSFKKIADPAAGLFNSFLAPREYTGKLVRTVEALEAIREIRKEQFEMSKLFHSPLKHVSLEKLSEPQKKAIEDVFKIQQIYYSLHDIQMKEGFELEERSDFQGFWAIFKEMASLGSVDIDKDVLREALEILNQTTPDKTTFEALPILERLNFNLDGFRILEAVPSLTFLDYGFKIYARELTRPEPVHKEFKRRRPMTSTTTTIRTTTIPPPMIPNWAWE